MDAATATLMAAMQSPVDIDDGIYDGTKGSQYVGLIIVKTETEIETHPWAVQTLPSLHRP